MRPFVTALTFSYSHSRPESSLPVPLFWTSILPLVQLTWFKYVCYLRHLLLSSSLNCFSLAIFFYFRNMSLEPIFSFTNSNVFLEQCFLISARASPKVLSSESFVTESSFLRSIQEKDILMVLWRVFSGKSKDISEISVERRVLLGTFWFLEISMMRSFCCWIKSNSEMVG